MIIFFLRGVSLLLKSLGKTLNSLAINTLFFVWAAVAVRFETDWLVYPLIVFVWLMLILYAAARFLGSARPIPRHLHMWITRIMDIGVLALFVYGGLYVTAIAFVASCVILDSIEQPLVN